MLADISIQPDDIESLQADPPLYDYQALITQNRRRVKLLLEKYMSKDNDTFEQIWRTGGEVPERMNSFYSHFPKKPSNLDSEHHYTSLINLNHFYLGRWLPGVIQKFLFPFDEALSESRLKLTSKAVPTREECHLCEELQGQVVYDRGGVWYCVEGGAVRKVLGVERDSLGDKFFESYRDYAAWKHEYTERVSQLEAQELACADDEEAGRIESQLKELEQLRRESKVPSRIILSKTSRK